MATINEYKNRMTSPIGAVRVNPKNGKQLPPIKEAPKKAVKRK